MRSKTGLGLVLGLMLAGIAALQPRAMAAEVEAINGNLMPPFLVWGTDQAGWVFRPIRDLLVDGVFSTFRNVGAASQSGPVLRRDVTVQLRRGDARGELLAQGVFSADASAGALGVRFEPVLLLAGQAYFISYRGLNNLGLNIVDWNITAPSPQQPAGTVNLDGWYSGPDFETYVPQVVNGTLQVFSAPILRFEGTAVTQLPAVDCLFQWAEAQVPAVLASTGAATGVFQSWYYRYYPATQVYLGVAMGSGRVAYLAQGSLTELGGLVDWLAPSGCNATR